MQNKVRAQSNTKCVQCGRNIFKGDECYQYATGIGVLGYGKVFCSEGCINAYKGATNSSSESSGRTVKVRHGSSFSSKPLIVKAIIVFFAICFIIGIGMTIDSCIENAAAKRASKKMPAAEYVVDKSSVTLTGKLNECFDVVDDIKVVSKEGAYAAVVTLTVKCKKEISSIEKFDTTYLMFDDSYKPNSINAKCITTPSDTALGAALYAMKAGEEKQIKIKIEPDSTGGKSAIDAYKNFLEAAEMGTMTLTYQYWDKKKAWRYDF